MVLFLGGPCAIWAGGGGGEGGGGSPVSALSKTVNDNRTGLSDSTTYMQRGELRTNKQNSSCNCQLCVYSQDATDIYPTPSCV